MQVKMAAASGICVGFLVLVLFLSHGSWSGSARVDNEFMISQSKMQLDEVASRAVSEPIQPNDMSDKMQLDEVASQVASEPIQPNDPSDTKMALLEAVHRSASPTSTGSHSAQTYPPQTEHGCHLIYVLQPNPAAGQPNCVLQPSPECFFFQPNPTYLNPRCVPSHFEPTTRCLNPGCIAHSEPVFPPQHN
ncbi:hypothetical protein HanRHA438_Chr13g0603561 [Helianthus annuus]|nr:hypothetical protein HanRHA438_Chr13g0603561 [Helianthus annuus]